MSMEYCKAYNPDGSFLTYYAMKHYYDERDAGEHILMRIEKSNDEDAFAEFVLPAIYCRKSFGFSELELGKLRGFILNNSPLIWDMTSVVTLTHL